MKNSIKALMVATALTLGFSASAEAYPYHGGGWHGGGGFSLYVGGPAYGYGGYYPYPAYYYPPYPYPYAYPPAGYAPAPGYAQPQPQPVSASVPEGNGAYCREYRSNAMIDGHYQQTYGTACQQPDGTWRMINQN